MRGERYKSQTTGSFWRPDTLNSRTRRRRSWRILLSAGLIWECKNSVGWRNVLLPKADRLFELARSTFYLRRNTHHGKDQDTRSIQGRKRNLARVGPARVPA